MHIDLKAVPTAVIYGLPGAGKSSVATVLAGLMGGQHLEMSAFARSIYKECASTHVTYEDFVRHELWAAGDFGRVARLAVASWRGGPAVVSGPRRTEELEELTLSLPAPLVFRVRLDEKVRVARAALRGTTAEDTTRRAANESAWGLVGRSVPGAIEINNNATLTEAIWMSVQALTGIEISKIQGNCRDSVERETRFAVEYSERISDRLRLAGPVTEENIVDDWYIPSHIRTRSEHDRWLKSGVCAPVRIRHGSNKVRVTIKSPPTVQGVAQELTLWAVDDTAASSLAALEELGLKRAVRLRKLRQRATIPSEGVTLCYDRYESGIGCLEIESRRESYRPSIPDLSDEDAGWQRYFEGVRLEPSRPVPLQAIEDSLERPAP